MVPPPEKDETEWNDEDTPPGNWLAAGEAQEKMKKKSLKEDNGTKSAEFLPFASVEVVPQTQNISNNERENEDQQGEYQSISHNERENETQHGESRLGRSYWDREHDCYRDHDIGSSALGGGTSSPHPVAPRSPPAVAEGVVALSTRPGAVAVPGPPESLCRETSHSIVPDESTPSDEGMPEISAYVVEEDSMSPEQRRETIRREVLSEAVEAMRVMPSRLNRSYCTLAGIATALIAGIVVGITVPLVRKSGSSQAVVTGKRDENVLAFIESRYSDSVGFRGFASVELQFIEFANVTTGYAGNIVCKVRPCIEDPGACQFGKDIYEPGCCLGMECDEETKCGEQCPPVPESCYLTDPSKIDCHSKDCYTCYQVNEQDIWLPSDRVWSIDCLKVGTAIREDKSEKYKWAIICGSIISGAVEQANFGLGEYACQAFRTGAGFTHEDGGIIAPWIPCQFISLGECGCAPADVYTFGLSPPTRPCLPEGNCTFLCSDAGKEHAQNLCHAFPGDIKWWEGANFMNLDTFAFNIKESTEMGSVEIYMKSED